MLKTNKSKLSLEQLAVLRWPPLPDRGLECPAHVDFDGGVSPGERFKRNRSATGRNASARKMDGDDARSQINDGPDLPHEAVTHERGPRITQHDGRDLTGR